MGGDVGFVVGDVPVVDEVLEVEELVVTDEEEVEAQVPPPFNGHCCEGLASGC